MSKHKIGIIGGTGLYSIEGFTNQKWVKVKTPFGKPSDDLLTGKIAGRDVVFLPRHGRGHRILPGELNHRANIWAMKKLGVAWIISVSAVGSLQAKYKPCDIVLIDQFVDRTKQSLNHTFFGRGIVAHIAFADPICSELRQLLWQSARAEKARVHNGGAADGLSGREIEVLRLIGLGHTNAEIGELLALSVRTVESHRASIHRKLRLSTRAELVRYALRRGLLAPELANDTRTR